MTERCLKDMTMKELRTTAKGYGIQGRWDMTKEQLVTAIETVSVELETHTGVMKEEICSTCIYNGVQSEDIVNCGACDSGDHRVVRESARQEVKAATEVKASPPCPPVKAAVIAAQNVPAKIQGAVMDVKAKQRYIENVEVGTIVAFKVVVCGIGKVKSAAVVNISIKRQMLKLVTKAEIEYVVPFKDILWVRTGKRWPKGVYELLKGLKPNV